MSIEIIEEFLSKIDMSDLDVDLDSDVQFEYKDLSCTLQSDNDSVKLIVEDEGELVSDNVDELVCFFTERLNVKFESVLDELENEFRKEFK